jgi:NAD(P)H-hydrate epimerase
VRQYIATAEDVAASLPARPLDAHKGTFGRALLAAGSINYTGAALLAGQAAYQVGAGLVRLALPAPLHAALAGQIPEATWLILPHEMGVIAEAAASVLLKNLEKATALLVGPGLGLEDSTAAFVRSLLSGHSIRSQHGRIGFIAAPQGAAQAGEDKTLPPLVLDADALKLIASIEDWWKLLPEQTVLTPHPGEMAALTGLSIDHVQADRAAVALKYARQWDCVVLLKGAFSVVAAPSGHLTVIPVATPALAKAGSGDVLAGILVGLMAQGMPAYPAAIAAAWLHAQAGLQAESDLESPVGVLASDILAALPAIFSRLSDLA